MVDYREIGSRIRMARLRKGMTQERLAELSGVGTPHISHIETGNTIPSLKIFVAIINALECSADELLCLEDCSQEEMRVIADVVAALKDSLRRRDKER